MFKHQSGVMMVLAIIMLVVLPSKGYSQTALNSGAGEGVFEGVLQPIREIDVASADFAILRELRVKPGMRLKMGDVIAVLEGQDFENQLEIAKAEFNSRGKLEQIEVELKLQLQKIETLSQLFETGKANLQELQRAQSDLEITQARLRSEQESIEIQGLQVARLQHMLEQTFVRSPINGIVVEIQKEVGEFVASHSPSVVRMHDISKLKATFPMSEDEVVRLNKRSTMKVRLSDGRVTDGEIEFIPPVADPESGWFMVTVVIDNADESIRCSRCSRAGSD